MNSGKFLFAVLVMRQGCRHLSMTPNHFVFTTPLRRITYIEWTKSFKTPELLIVFVHQEMEHRPCRPVRRQNACRGKCMTTHAVSPKCRIRYGVLEGPRAVRVNSAMIHFAPQSDVKHASEACSALRGDYLRAQSQTGQARLSCK